MDNEKKPLFKTQRDNYDYQFEIQETELLIDITCCNSFTKYSTRINHQAIKTNKNLDFFFETPTDLFSYVSSSFADIRFSKNGELLFQIEMNLGQKSKTYECRIDLEKTEVSQEARIDLKFQKMQNQIEDLRRENLHLKETLEVVIEEQRQMKNQIEHCEKMMNSKDEVLTTIFQQIRELKIEKELQQKKIEEAAVPRFLRFVSDDYNPHNKKFQQKENRFKKIASASWDILLGKNPIPKGEISRYVIKQVHAGNNGSFMYGIGTESLRGINRAQDSKQFVGYYEYNGNVYQEGKGRKGGQKIKDGDVLVIEIDTVTWKVEWMLNDKKETESDIALPLRGKPIYLAIVFFNEDAEIEFM